MSAVATAEVLQSTHCNPCERCQECIGGVVNCSSNGRANACKPRIKQGKVTVLEIWNVFSDVVPKGDVPCLNGGGGKDGTRKAIETAAYAVPQQIKWPKGPRIHKAVSLRAQA